MVANDAMELARMCARAADDAKAENVRVYDLRGMSSLTDFMVVCPSPRDATLSRMPSSA